MSSEPRAITPGDAAGMLARGEPCPCFRCERTEGVALESSRTMYVHADGSDDKGRNAPVPLCRACAKEHHDYWDEMWAEYRQGLL